MGRIMLATSNSTDEEYGGTFATQASEVGYDNTSSGLTADDVQEAIDEVNGKFPYKTKLLENIGFTFNNSMFSSTINISTITGAVVTKDNVKAVIATGVGVDGYALLTGNKTQCGVVSSNVLTGTYNYNLLFIYSS